MTQLPGEGGHDQAQDISKLLPELLGRTYLLHDLAQYPRADGPPDDLGMPTRFWGQFNIQGYKTAAIINSEPGSVGNQGLWPVLQIYHPLPRSIKYPNAYIKESYFETAEAMGREIEVLWATASGEIEDPLEHDLNTILDETISEQLVPDNSGPSISSLQLKEALEMAPEVDELIFGKTVADRAQEVIALIRSATVEDELAPGSNILQSPDYDEEAERAELAEDNIVSAELSGAATEVLSKVASMISGNKYQLYAMNRDEVTGEPGQIYARFIKDSLRVVVIGLTAGGHFLPGIAIFHAIPQSEEYPNAYVRESVIVDLDRAIAFDASVEFRSDDGMTEDKAAVLSMIKSEVGASDINLWDPNNYHPMYAEARQTQLKRVVEHYPDFEDLVGASYLAVDVAATARRMQEISKLLDVLTLDDQVVNGSLFFGRE